MIKKNYRLANNRVIQSVEAPIVRGAFSAELMIPTDLPKGKVYIKAYAAGEKADAACNMELNVR